MTIESYQNGRPYTGDGLLALGDEMTMVVTSPEITISDPHIQHPFDQLFVPFPEMGNRPYHVEPIHFDPNNLPFISLSSIRTSVKQINTLIDKSRDAYPKYIEEYQKAANSDVTMVNNSDLKKDPELRYAADILQEALNALQVNIDLKNVAEQDVVNKTLEAEKGFNAFVNDKGIQLANFKDKPPEMFDVVLSIICGNNGMGKSYILKKWHEMYVSKLQEEMAARNNLVTYLSLIKTITEDVIQKTASFRKIRDRFIAKKAEAAAKRWEESLAETEAEEKRKAEARAKAQAEAKVKAEAQARQIADARAKVIADREAKKAKELAEENARTQALWSVGLIPALNLLEPVDWRAVEAMDAMKAVGAITLVRAAGGGMQLAVAGQGTLVTTGAVTEAVADVITRGVAAVMSSASHTAAAIVAAFWPTEAGKESDIPGRDVEALFAIQAELLTGAGAIQPGMKTVEMPVRGSLVMDNDHLVLKLLKTDANLPKTVQIVEAERDYSTGLDIITLPALKDQPAQTLLINPWLKKEIAPPETEARPTLVLPTYHGPLPLPTGQMDSPTVLASPETPVYTGTEIKPVDQIRITTTPDIETSLRDFIYWQLDASGTGVEPVYVMLSDIAADNTAKEAAEKDRLEKEALTKTSELIVDMGDKVGEILGDKYKSIANEIASNINNFQGKTIRSYDDAMKSLNKITSNPAMKINKADKDAIVNAWKHVDAQYMANKLGNLSKAFKVADVVMKIEKVREKSIEGYETGNWGPLMLEVESWVLSGMTAAVAMAILAYVAPIVATTVGLPILAITIAGIIGISLVSSMIDDRLAEKINKELVK